MPYGNDECSQRLEAKFSDLFETAFPVATGSAAPAGSRDQPPWCDLPHAESHINVDECGAPNFTRVVRS